MSYKKFLASPWKKSDGLIFFLWQHITTSQKDYCFNFCADEPHIKVRGQLQI